MENTRQTPGPSVLEYHRVMYSVLLFSLYTNDCVFKEPAVKILKFADDTTMVGLIANSDESGDGLQVQTPSTSVALWFPLWSH